MHSLLPPHLSAVFEKMNTDILSWIILASYLLILIYEVIAVSCKTGTRREEENSAYRGLALACIGSIFLSAVILCVRFLDVVITTRDHNLITHVAELVFWMFNVGTACRAFVKCRRYYPWVLRSWWICSFLLSLLHTYSTRRFLDFLVLVVSTFLVWLSIYGKTGVNVSETASDPLLKKTKSRSLFENASFVDLITFSWMNPVFVAGAKHPLQEDEVPDVSDADAAATLAYSFDESLPFYKAVYMLIKRKAAINAAFAVVNASVAYVPPFLINSFVRLLTEGGRKEEGYQLAVMFLTAKIVETVAQRQWIFGARRLGLGLRASLVARIYRKGLVLSNRASQNRTSGEMINVMSVDVQRVSDFIWYMNLICMLPIQTTLAMVVLNANLGKGSWAALAATSVVIALYVPLTRFQKRFQAKIMEAKDDRMKSTTETLRNMKTIKVQGWDTRFLGKVKDLRRKEREWVWRSQKLEAFSTFVFWGSPSFISVVTFFSCMIMGIPLTSGRVLSALATFRMLQDPIYNLPTVLSVVAQGRVSGDRIASFLKAEEINHTDILTVFPEMTCLDVDIDKGIFSWNPDTDKVSLNNVNLRVKKGCKVAICGTVGSGKSSLISAVTGEIPKISGTVKVAGKKAYVSQTPWVMTGNVRDNILFGNQYDVAKYSKTVEACALVKDFDQFPGGDMTEIGERGINISGGQKQRIQIARAVYEDADVYLLDDPFSAVDAHTGTHLFNECLLGVLKDKTVIYVTHQVDFLSAADLIVVMRNGEVSQAGSFDELLKSNADFEALVGAHKEALEGNFDVGGESKTEPTVNDDGGFAIEDKGKAEKLVNEEERQQGGIGMEVYRTYLTAFKGGALVPVILLAQASFQGIQVASNYWMAWSSPPTEAIKPVLPISSVVCVYAVLSLGCSICVLIRASLVAIAGLSAAEKLFDGMLQSVMRAPMSFFDSTPSGRILNRASNDQSVVDLELQQRVGWCAFSVIQLLGTIAVMSQAAWEVFLIFIPVTAICVWYQRYYTPTARELARLAEIQRAPILHHFGESLAGASIIRAYTREPSFIYSNLSLIDRHSRPWFHNVAAIEWLSFRLNLLSNFVFAFSLVILVSLPQGIITPSAAGLAVTYGINLNILQASVIWNACNAENKMIAVERILQYSSIPSEAPLEIEETKPSATWPETGTIAFKELHVGYSQRVVLKDVTCVFPGRAKIGVVGRTGSGKSTLIQALFRIVEPMSGSIIIDDINISNVGLHDLRSKLSIIPQDPSLFEGDVRGNLDPLSQYTDLEIWEALDTCQLGKVLRGKDGGLGCAVVENGENWSCGQRQLFCLGRALLKKSKILVMDEATASVDSATDALIQSTIRREFDQRTVVTIAHRIHTVVDSDFVLVLDDGRVAEFDTPGNLLERKESYFSRLVAEYYSRSQCNIPRLK